MTRNTAETESLFREKERFQIGSRSTEEFREKVDKLLQEGKDAIRKRVVVIADVLNANNTIIPDTILDGRAVIHAAKEMGVESVTVESLGTLSKADAIEYAYKAQASLVEKTRLVTKGRYILDMEAFKSKEEIMEDLGIVSVSHFHSNLNAARYLREQLGDTEKRVYTVYTSYRGFRDFAMVRGMYSKKGKGHHERKKIALHFAEFLSRYPTLQVRGTEDKITYHISTRQMNTIVYGHLPIFANLKKLGKEVIIAYYYALFRYPEDAAKMEHCFVQKVLELKGDKAILMVKKLLRISLKTYDVAFTETIINKIINQKEVWSNYQHILYFFETGTRTTLLEKYSSPIGFLETEELTKKNGELRNADDIEKYMLAQMRQIRANLEEYVGIKEQQDVANTLYDFAMGSLDIRKKIIKFQEKKKE